MLTEMFFQGFDGLLGCELFQLGHFSVFGIIVNQHLVVLSLEGEYSVCLMQPFPKAFQGQDLESVALSVVQGHSHSTQYSFRPFLLSARSSRPSTVLL